MRRAGFQELPFLPPGPRFRAPPQSLPGPEEKADRGGDRKDGSQKDRPRGNPEAVSDSGVHGEAGENLPAGANPMGNVEQRTWERTRSPISSRTLAGPRMGRRQSSQTGSSRAAALLFRALSMDATATENYK